MNAAKYRAGFTFIEMLIVIVIMGIVASIVIPQFSIATDDAKLSALKSNLSAVRSQLQLYKLDHNDEYPPNKADAADLLEELTSKTNSDHTLTGTPKLGPYLLSIPDNPFWDGDPSAANSINDEKISAADGNKSAWYYKRDATDADEMEFLANDTTTSGNVVGHDTY